MPPKKRMRLTKKEYILRKIDDLIAEIYQNEIARDYLLLNEENLTDEQKKQVNAAKHNIERLSKQIEWLEVCLEKV